jgi:hypothetical protein
MYWTQQNGQWVPGNASNWQAMGDAPPVATVTPTYSAPSTSSYSTPVPEQKRATDQPVMVNPGAPPQIGLQDNWGPNIFSQSNPPPSYSTPIAQAGAAVAPPAPASQPQSLWNVQSATEIGRKLGLLGANEIAQGGLLNTRVQASDPKMQEMFNKIALSMQQGQQPDWSTIGLGGVMPIGQEPLNPWEKEGLSALAQGTTAQNELLQKANDLYAQISQQLNKASTPMSDSDFNALLARYQNPYQQQVVNQSIESIRRDADNARARLMAGSAAFGSSSQDRQLSELERSTQDAVARATSGLNYEGFNNLVSTIENRQNSDRSGALQAASTGLGAASGIANLGQTLRENTIADIMSKIGAGGYVRDYNQQLADKISGEYGRKEGYDSQKLQELMSLLSAFKEGSVNVPPQPNSASNLADKLGSLGQVANYFGTPTVNNLPWTSPGNVNPSGGFYF